MKVRAGAARRPLARTEDAAPGIVLDAGALLAVEDGRLTDVLGQAHALGIRVVTSGGAIAQAWRGGPRSARLASISKKLLHVVPIDAIEGRRIGELLAHVVRGRRSKPDIVDAHAALLARETRSLLFTSDPDDMRGLGVPDAQLRRV